MNAQTRTVLWPVLALVLSAACGSDGGPGEQCFRASDCQDALLCAAQGLGEEAGQGECVLDPETDPGGSYLDPLTGLEWQQTPTGGRLDWASAVRHCQQLDPTGGAWRLPTVDEMRSLFRGCPATESGGACSVTGACLSWEPCRDAPCDGCERDAGPAGGCYWPAELGGSCAPFYWSGSTVAEFADRAWYLVYSYGHVCARTKDFAFGLVRCAR